ncbi:hypothetical protein [Burkholderia sp. BE17]|uniref:hypothetical protein n=1 Tax=Burkholderia sp. BE17 TaxID=2656644 RepID=UPI00128B9460|nr:hypothetical protein [Burkholderia sp. BE17]MPV69143.1 hypothetical protein [Burkholderia sp. BE17]
MLNWDDEITAITDAEARMLRISLKRVQVILDRHDVSQVLQNPLVTAKELRETLESMYKTLLAQQASVAFAHQRMAEKLALAAILRRWGRERRTRAFNEGGIGRLPAVIAKVTRSAAASMRLVAPIGAPPRLA